MAGGRYFSYLLTVFPEIKQLNDGWKSLPVIARRLKRKCEFSNIAPKTGKKIKAMGDVHISTRHSLKSIKTIINKVAPGEASRVLTLLFPTEMKHAPDKEKTNTVIKDIMSYLEPLSKNKKPDAYLDLQGIRQKILLRVSEFDKKITDQCDRKVNRQVNRL